MWMYYYRKRKSSFNSTNKRTLIIQGNKRFEFRSWQTKYRGDLLIHARKGIDKETMKRLVKYIPEDMPTGKILGKVKPKVNWIYGNIIYGRNEL